MPLTSKSPKYLIYLRDRCIGELYVEQVNLTDIAKVGQLWPKTKQGIGHIIKKYRSK